MDTKIFSARVEEVHSGDDLVAMVDLGIDGLFKRVRVRLHGVDTPSAYRVKQDDEAGKIRDEVKSLLRDRQCRLEVHNQGRGGWLSTLYFKSGASGEETNLNAYLISRGFIYRHKQES